MSDDMMARIHAQRALEVERNGALRRQAEAEYAEANATFLREAPEVLSILRQHGVAPTGAYSCDMDYDGQLKLRHFKFVGMGWSMVGSSGDGGYVSTDDYVLMETGHLLDAYSMYYGDRPRRFRDVLAVKRPATPQWTWRTIHDVAWQVRRLIGE